MKSGAEIFEIARLALKYLRGELSPVEEARLNAWLEEDDRNRAFLESLTDEASMEEFLGVLSSLDTSAALQKVLQKIASPEQPEKFPHKGILRHLKSWKAVAAILLVLAGLAVFWQYDPYPGQTAADLVKNTQKQPTDVLPGGDKAVLHLADGSAITLENAADGTVKEGNGIRIRQLDGEVIYEVINGEAAGDQEVWHTISTPRGGQYQLKLPDGSKVWLNAGSDLRFPIVFAGRTREVELKGEAYFEVVRNKDRPFRVKVNGLSVEVLGTHFNVKAYDDEASIQTTLIEGKVRVRAKSGEKLLFPGRQASMDKATGQLQVKKVNTENVVAWKNGLFMFFREPVTNVMKKIGRWYDVKVIYREPIPEAEFNGMISRDVPLSEVLKMLEMTGGARFRMEGRNVVVLN